MMKRFMYTLLVATSAFAALSKDYDFAIWSMLLLIAISIMFLDKQ